MKYHNYKSKSFIHELLSEIQYKESNVEELKNTIEQQEKELSQLNEINGHNSISHLQSYYIFRE